MTMPAQPGSFDPNAGLVKNANQGPVPPPEKIAPNAYRTNLSDESVKQYAFEDYKGRTNTTDRIFLLRPFDIIKARHHYHEKVGYVACNSEFEIKGNQEVLQTEAACCKMLGPSKLRFGALILRYVTDKAGNLVRPFVMPEERLWKFGADKFTTLRAINADYPLGKHDLAITCTDETFQRLTMGAKPECVYLHEQFPADLKQRFETWAEASVPKILREIARPMSDADIAKELGQAGPAPAQTTAADAPVVDFANIIGAQK